MAPVALDHAAVLIAKLAGGEILRGVIDVYPSPRTRTYIELHRSEIQRVLGAEVPPRAQALRVIMSELTRLSSHLVWLGTSGIELGATDAIGGLQPPALEDREVNGRGQVEHPAAGTEEVAQTPAAATAAAAAARRRPRRPRLSIPSSRAASFAERLPPDIGLTRERQDFPQRPHAPDKVPAFGDC